MYVHLCPEDTLKNSLYLQQLKNPKEEQWYSKAPIGHNTLSGFVKGMMEAAGFQGNFTNHSLRVTAVTRLFDCGQDIKVIKNQTGHRSDALLAYRRIDTDRLKEVSEVLSVTNSAKRVKIDLDKDTQNESSQMNTAIELPKSQTTKGEQLINHFTFNITGGSFYLNMSNYLNWTHHFCNDIIVNH